MKMAGNILHTFYKLYTKVDLAKLKPIKRNR